MDGRDVRRGGGAVLISLLGAGVLVPNVARLATLQGPPAELGLAGLGAVLALVLVAAGVAVVWHESTQDYTLRIAGWAVLGTVVLALVLALIVAAGVALPLPAAATLLSVSTFAHVLIGVRDVQRIRAEDVARQREQLVVLNQLVRHNLRHEAQRLLYVHSMLPDADADERERLAADVDAVAGSLTAINDQLTRSQRLVGRDDGATDAVDLASAVEDVVAEYRAAHPDATITTDVPPDLRVVGGSFLRHAVAELVENALVHTGEAPRVTIEAVADGGNVTLHVADDGPGIQEPDRSVITREAEITQLSHSQGIGLWFVRWVVDAYDGGFHLDSGGDGTTVRVSLPRVRA